MNMSLVFKQTKNQTNKQTDKQTNRQKTLNLKQKNSFIIKQNLKQKIVLL